MEHEDNAQYENFLQNAQDLMANMQISPRNVGGVAAGQLANATVGDGGKFDDEHDDEEEWKYIKEVQQTEKQLPQQHAAEVANGNGNADLLEQQQQGQQNDEIGSNGLIEAAAVANAADDLISGFGIYQQQQQQQQENVEVDLDVDVLKNDADFSNTSNTASTAGDADVDANVLQVEMKIEQQPALAAAATELLLDDDETSSLATNGTSSLSENLPAQQQQQQQQLEQLEEEQQAANIERPANLDLQHNSHLNPAAKEFVPSFGSPTSPAALLEDAIDATTQQIHLNVMPTHVLDDILAASPRKERAADMADFTLLPESEFDVEAQKRPHELTDSDQLLTGAGDGIGNGLNNGNFSEMAELQRQSPASFIDHGPETSVDLDAELIAAAAADNERDVDDDDIMRRSIYVEHADNEAIENVLNTVQPLPTDLDLESGNTSFVEENAEPTTTTAAAAKELFDADEKEYVSQSPSTEELQMNLQNNLRSNETMPAEMTASFYDEHTSADAMQQQQLQQYQQQEAEQQLQNETLLFNTTNLLDDSVVNNSQEQSSDSFEKFATTLAEPLADFQSNEYHREFELATSPSPHSTEEKHLMEETKETQQQQQPEVEQQLSLENEQNLSEIAAADVTASVDEINEKIDALSLSDNVGALSQIDEVAPVAITNNQLESAIVKLEPNEDIAEIPHTTDFEQQEKELHENVIADEPASNNNQLESAIVKQEENEAKDEDTIAVVAGSATAAVAAAAATTAAVAAAATKAVKKTTSARATLTAASKPKAAAATAPALKKQDVKKPTTSSKSPTAATSKATTNAAATTRPRTAPASKTAGVGTTTNTTTAAAAARKPFSASAARSTAPRTATSTISSSRPNTVTSSTAATKTSSAGAALKTRKPATAAAAATNGNTTAVKPTTLGLSSVAKPKLSPRSTLTSQLRRASPNAAAGSTNSTAAAVKSPRAGTSNGVSTTTTTKTLASRAAAKPTTTTTTITTKTTTVKTFTARPAPKFTHSAAPTLSSTARRVAAHGSSSSNATTANKTSSAAAIKKASPSKKIANVGNNKVLQQQQEQPLDIPKTNGTLNGEPAQNGIHSQLATAEVNLIDA